MINPAMMRNLEKYDSHRVPNTHYGKNGNKPDTDFKTSDKRGAFTS